MQSFMQSRQSEIDKFLLQPTISSIGAPIGPHTSETTQTLLKIELKNRVIHEGIGKGGKIPVKKSIFFLLFLASTLKLNTIETIQYDKTGPPTYSERAWQFVRGRKRAKRTRRAKYVVGSTEDEGTEDDEAENDEAEDDEAEDDSEDDNTGDGENDDA
jgi:hypothetical protein